MLNSQFSILITQYSILKPTTENREPRTENREPRTDNREPTTLHFIEKISLIINRIVFINIFTALPFLICSNAESRTGMNFYYFIFEN
jgi:hypothetical protein